MGSVVKMNDKTAWDYTDSTTHNDEDYFDSLTDACDLLIDRVVGMYVCMHACMV